MSLTRYFASLCLAALTLNVLYTKPLPRKCGSVTLRDLPRFLTYPIGDPAQIST
jgi:hypothetical protein